MNMKKVWKGLAVSEKKHTFTRNFEVKSKKENAGVI
jgi:hypothetical protein